MRGGYRKECHLVRKHFCEQRVDFALWRRPAVHLLPATKSLSGSFFGIASHEQPVNGIGNIKRL